MHYEIAKKLEKDDLVIAIMGPTGSGKTKIISVLSGLPEERVGAKLESHTTEATAIRIKGHAKYGDRVVLLNTPGFDDTTKSDAEILQIISEWLVNAYKSEVYLTGILYLHRITDNRMAGTPHRNLKMFGQLCGDKAAKGVVLVTMMWDMLNLMLVGEKREDDLKTKIWAPLLENEATVDRFHNTQESAWRIIDRLITLRHQGEEGVVLLLQEEIVDLERTLKETKVGQTLYVDLQNLLAQQQAIAGQLAKKAKEEKNLRKAAEYDEKCHDIQSQIDQVASEISNLHVSFSRKIKLTFWKKSDISLRLGTNEGLGKAN